jgi:spermidine synthase
MIFKPHTTKNFQSSDNMTLTIIKAGILLLGFSSIITQLLFIKEFMSVFNGNELILGIVVANWMILTGLGAFIGKKNRRSKNRLSFYSNSIFLSGFIPLVTIFLLYYLKNQIFPLGSIVSVVQVFTFSLILLSPYCLLTGYLFTVYSVDFSENVSSNKVSYMYSLESFGSILGGFIFSFVVIRFLKTYEALGLLFFLSGTTAILFRREEGLRLSLFFPALISLIIPLYCIMFDMDKHIKRFVYPYQKIINSIDSPYGNIVITSQEGQINVFENSILLFSSNNTIHDEESVHFAMIQHSDPKEVLIISGGSPGIFNEILKYKVNRIVYAEINPAIIDLLKKEGALNENIKIHAVNKDARQYIRNTQEKFDIAFINLPPPDNFQINRYYSSEFILLLKNILTRNGIVCYNLPSTINYVSKEALEINSILYQTLKRHFINVILIAGELNYYIASNNDLSLNITRLVQEKHINNKYVNQYYLNDRDIQSRSLNIIDQLKDIQLLNTDFLPFSYFKQIKYQLSQFNTNYTIVIIALILLLIFVIIRIDIITLGVFVAGFSVSSLEILILLSFQVFFGYIYFVAGIFFAVFMAGLVLGASFKIKTIFRSDLNNFLFYQLGIAFMALVYLIYILIFKSFYNAILIQLFSTLIILFIGFFMGRLFSFATRIQNSKIAAISAHTYGFDLIGSALGVLIISSVLLPFIGFIKLALFLCFINLLTAFIVHFKKAV